MINIYTGLYAITALLIGLALAFSWWRRFDRARKRQAEWPSQLFAQILPLLTDHHFGVEQTVGTCSLHGTYKGKDFQFKAITDTLAARKLPSLWLMLTRPAPQPVPQVFDCMMRPAGPTTFSNFDFLPHTLQMPSGFPQQMVLRSDAPTTSPVLELARAMMPLFTDAPGKELLISPKGLRLVTLIAEADRVRYGVFRQSEFGEIVVEANLALRMMDALITLEENLLQNSKKVEQKP